MSRTTRLIAAVVAVLIAAVVGYRQSVAPHVGLPPVVGPAGNGLVAYTSDGDIFVGDPVTGTSTAVVTGPSIDSRPIFSPDGLRIAFLRARSESDMSVVVIRSDGTDERVIVAEGFNEGAAYAWTPDSTSLVVPYSDGGLSLFNASGVGEPRLITPPLPAEIGYTYISIHAPVAPMFQPPTGDAILSHAGGVLSVVDLDGTDLEGFVTPSLTEFEPYFLRARRGPRMVR